MDWTNNFRREMSRLQRRFDNLLGDFFEPESFNEDLSYNYRKARTNFSQTEKEFIVNIELPGVEKEDIELNVTDKGIEISAEKRKEKKEGEEGKDYRHYKSYVGFYRTFEFPEEADLNKIDASYKNGVLTIRLPKIIKAERDKKTIQIK